MNPTHQLFYQYTEFLLSLVGGFVLWSIWQTIQQKFKQKLASEITIKRLDKGLLFISLSVFVWAFSALLGIVYQYYQINHWIKIINLNMFSILNSLFLILALFYLDNSPSYLYNNKKSTFRIILFFVVLSIFSLGIALFFGETIQQYGFRLNTIPDLILSTILAWFLMVSLYRTFINRAMKTVAFIAVISVVVLYLTQLSIVFNLEEYTFSINLIKLLAKTSLIYVFLVLGTSWALELAQLPEAKTMKIVFLDWNKISITIPTKNIINQEVNFGKKTTQFNNLLKFAIRRKYAPEKQMCIEVYNGGEILSQTYLTRIIDNINELLNLENEEKLNRNDFFTFIGQAKYRLRFLPEHISIQTQLLQEFIQNLDFPIYSEFKE